MATDDPENPVGKGEEQMTNGTIPEPKAWSLTNTMLAALGALLLLFISLGFYSITAKIDAGDQLIYTAIGQLRTEVTSTNTRMNKLCEDVTRIDTLQQIRIKKEDLEGKTRIRK